MYLLEIRVYNLGPERKNGKMEHFLVSFQKISKVIMIKYSIALALVWLSVADSKLIRSKQQNSLKAQPTLQNMPKISKERGDPNISRPGETGKYFFRLELFMQTHVTLKPQACRSR